MHARSSDGGDMEPVSTAVTNGNDTEALLERQPEPAAPDEKHWVTIIALCTLAIFICYADRSNISVAIIKMAEAYNWDDGYKGTILSVFFLGYAATQLLGGTLSDRYGGKLILTYGVIAWSLFTFVTPQAATSGTLALVSCRVLMGLGEGVAFPAIHSIVSTNVPLGYQSTAVAVVTAASYAGAAVAAGLSPWIISNFEWPMVFYVFGASAVLWIPFWVITPVGSRSTSASLDAGAGDVSVRETPPAPPDVQEREERMLADESTSKESTLASRIGLDDGFFALLKRQEVWAICGAQYCQSWGMYALLNWLPTFFSEQYAVDISDLGKYTLVPPLIQAVVGGFSGVIADNIIVRGYSVKTTRRVLQVAGMLGPAACLLLAVSPALESNPSAASALVTAAQGFSALTLAAVSVSQLDIAPKHAGAIFGLGNTLATVSGLLSTKATGQILESTHSWPLVFGVTAAHYVVGAGIWYVWVGDEPLPEDDL